MNAQQYIDRLDIAECACVAAGLRNRKGERARGRGDSSARAQAEWGVAAGARETLRINAEPNPNAPSNCMSRDLVKLRSMECRRRTRVRL